ncbi:hypothetical protein MHA01_17440 [Marinococcus halophilus]|uniref:Uncharacterized protein n=1 Tax=Marinococcus halophilus TaxID=1371 RepID=A0A510Y645_MARHA|nr:hypothetical protein MHA01_17440 [Marinococcus halophilus]
MCHSVILLSKHEYIYYPIIRSNSLELNGNVRRNEFHAKIYKTRGNCVEYKKTVFYLAEGAFV